MTSAEQIFSPNTMKVSTLETTTAMNNPSPYRLNVADVAAQFSLEYYNSMSRQPETLHYFYGKLSHMVHSAEGDLEAPICKALETIHSRIMAMDYKGARIIVESIDAQPSMNGGIFVQTTGNMKMKSGVARRFVQSIFLAEQPNGYFVLNDCFRFINAANASAPPNQAPSAKSTTQTPVEESKESVAAAAPPSQAKASKQPAASKQAEIPAASCQAPEPQAAAPVAEQKPASTPAVEKTVQKPITAPGRTGNQASSQKFSQAQAQALPSNPNPGSWASLAAGRADLWQDGVVAPTKAPVVEKLGPVEQAQQKGFSTNKGERREYKPRNETRPPRSDVNTSRPNYNNSEAKSPQDYSRSVFIRNLPGDISAEELSKALEAAGIITSFEMNQVKCQAFVEFETSDMAQIAISAKHAVRGTPMTIDARRPAGPRGPNFKARRE